MNYYYLVLQLIPLGWWIYAQRYLKQKTVQYRSSNKFIPTQQIKRNLSRSLKTSSTILILLNFIFFFCNVRNYYFITVLNVIIPIVSYLSSKMKEPSQKTSK